MGSIIFLAIMMLGLCIGVPAYAAIDWFFSYKKRGISFRDYIEKF